VQYGRGQVGWGYRQEQLHQLLRRQGHVELQEALHGL
jgi:hypothetical protein